MACLIITNGLDQGRLFQLPEGEYILGRDETADIQIELSAISRRHAAFEVGSTEVILRDLESSNGTYHNGEVVKNSVTLQDGDAIQIADLTLTFQLESTSDVPDAENKMHKDFASTATVETLKARSELLKRLRNCFYEAGFDEVETPALSADTVVDRYLHPISVEVGSRQYWLQTSPEFGMKRLLASGMEAIFQVCHVYRDEEAGPFHNLEFTMVEWYRVGDTTEQAIKFLGELAITLLEYDRYEVISYQQAFQNILEFEEFGFIAAVPATMKNISKMLVETYWLIWTIVITRVTCVTIRKKIDIEWLYHGPYQNAILFKKVKYSSMHKKDT